MKMFTNYFAFVVAILAMTMATQSTANAQNGCCEPIQPCCEQTVSYAVANYDCCDSTSPSYLSYDIQPNYVYTTQYSTQPYTSMQYSTPQYYTTQYTPQYQTFTANRTFQPLSSGYQKTNTRRARRITQRNNDALCCN